MVKQIDDKEKDLKEELEKKGHPLHGDYKLWKIYLKNEFEDEDRTPEESQESTNSKREVPSVSQKSKTIGKPSKIPAV